MRVAPYLISLCLHAAVFLLIWFWPATPPVRLDSPPIMISLVEGAPGGNRAPSPILGHMGEATDGPLAPTPPAPMSEIAAPANERRPEPKPLQNPAPEKSTPQKPEPKAIPIAAKKPETPVAEPKKPEPRRDEPAPRAKPEAKKEEPKKEAPKKETPKKEQPQKKPEKKAQPKSDPIADALRQARKASSRANSGDRGNAIEQALAQARKGAGGTRGGGGGEGDGPGGGGLGDVYMGQVMLAVRPNWGFASAGRLNLRCLVKVQVDMQGNVLQAVLSQSSGNAQYDASAINAVIRTGQAGQFPAPPSPQYRELDLIFNFNDLMGR